MPFDENLQNESIAEGIDLDRSQGLKVAKMTAFDNIELLLLPNHSL